MTEDAGASHRRSRILNFPGAGGTRNAAIALTSTLVFLALIAVVVVNSAGWPEVKKAFFNGAIFRASFGEIAHAFLLNVRIFLIAEAVILVFALLIAVLRGLPGPVLFPFRALAVVYTDLFRGIPTILVIYVLGFGAPALQLSGVPSSPLFWGIVSLVLVYSAYVAEVYRAGIESVHPSQEAAARSLGLSRPQALRFVILPQAVRRVVPPLLNDFIGLQKDSALVALIGPIEAFRQAQIDVAGTFNYTPYLVTALLFVLLTIPLARLTDWLIARDRRRQVAGGVR
ncbi:MAG: amino acid ABC transporter permease [Actinomycetota bacterium]|nr:amino acid ABC transporter permease [Actinomycetota bacterium]